MSLRTLKVEGDVTLIARPADLYSRRSGRICSASIIVETQRLTGPGPSPT